MKNPNTVTIYACGGAAINILGKLPVMEDRDHAFASNHLVAIDTSTSNLPKIENLNFPFYHVENPDVEQTDGSGKDRSANLAAAKHAAPEILSLHPPGDLNIVVHSTGGGSGAPIGQILVGELLNRDQNVIVIAIESRTSVKEITNTLETLVSYESMAHKRQKTIPISLLSNTQRRFAENDDLVRLTVMTLSMFWSGMNHGLDRKDLNNFLNCQSVTKYEPAAVGLGLVSGNDSLPEMKRGTQVGTMVSLIGEDQDPDPGILVNYHAYGRPELAQDSRLKVPLPVHLYTIQGHFTEVIAELNKQVQGCKENYRANPISTANLKAVDSSDMTLID